jgi:hypothetical protein
MTAKVGDRLTGGGGYAHVGVAAGIVGIVPLGIPSSCFGRSDEVAIFNSTESISVDDQ